MMFMGKMGNLRNGFGWPVESPLERQTRFNLCRSEDNLCCEFFARPLTIDPSEFALGFAA